MPNYIVTIELEEETDNPTDAALQAITSVMDDSIGIDLTVYRQDTGESNDVSFGKDYLDFATTKTQSGNKMQELMFQIMELSSFNEFNGERVVNDLRKNKSIWKGALFGRFGGYSELVILRDIGEDYYNADTLMILPVDGKEDELEKLASGWSADEVGWIGGEEACSMLGSYSPNLRKNQKQVLRVWWD